jgi:hypothetical protein
VGLVVGLVETEGLVEKAGSDWAAVAGLGSAAAAG